MLGKSVLAVTQKRKKEGRDTILRKRRNIPFLSGIRKGEKRQNFGLMAPRTRETSSLKNGDTFFPTNDKREKKIAQ